MDHVLQKLTSIGIVSMHDRFVGYNQLIIKGKYYLPFTTPWGTLVYIIIPFGLPSVGSTFQRALDNDFKEIMGKFIMVY